jgi:integral membrane protein (TIGR01906 family)
MKTSSSFFHTLFGWLVTLIVPYLILVAIVRLLLTPFFLQVEYHTPNFPADPYGFSLNDRLHWAPYAVSYLVNNAGSQYLADLKLANGSPLFNADEVGHMVDVKNLVQVVLRGWLICAALFIIIGIWAWRSYWFVDFRYAVGRGGWLTVGLLVAILLLVLTSFDSLFIEFHRIFFPGGNWSFPTTDTLIRLFPLRFWQDCFIAVGGLSLILGLIAGLTLSKKSK